MSTLETVPELADGGYWYVVESAPHPELGGQTPGDIPGLGWCAWYGTVNGVSLVAVRCPELVTGVPTVDVPVADVLAAAGAVGKPYGRVGGI